MCKHCYGYEEKEKYKYPKVDDWEDPKPVHHPRKTKQKAPKAKPRGCHENDGGPHVYVVIEIRGFRRNYSDMSKKIPTTMWIKRCIGCGKTGRKYYWWDGDAVGRHFNKEDIYAVENVDSPYPWLW